MGTCDCWESDPRQLNRVVSGWQTGRVRAVCCCAFQLQKMLSVGGIYIGNGSNISVSSHKSEFTVGSSISVVFPYGKHPSYTSMKQNCQVSKKKRIVR